MEVLQIESCFEAGWEPTIDMISVGYIKGISGLSQRLFEISSCRQYHMFARNQNLVCRTQLEFHQRGSEEMK